MTRNSQTQTGGRPATKSVIPGQYALSVGKPAKSPPFEWEWVLLTDVARLETGHTPSRKHPEYWDGEIPWIGIKDATTNHGRVIYDTYQHTNELGIANSSARILPQHTVCLSRTASVGYVVVMGRPMATSQDFVNWVCSEAIDYRFLKAVLLAEGENLLRFASGTTHQTIYFPEVKAFHVCLPPLPEQRAIAHILGSLDDKIELNRRMNTTLEGIARAIFKSWFVDFDPVYAKASGEQPSGMDAETAALFPDDFEDSELGPIPRGWEIRSLDEIANYLNGLAMQKYAPEGSEFLPVIKIRELRQGFTDDSSGQASPDIDPAYIVNDGDVIFSWSGSLLLDIWTGETGGLNQHLFKVTSEHFPRWFYYFWTKHHLEEFQRIAAFKATTMGHIQRRHLSDALTVVPTGTVLEYAGQTIGSMLDTIINNRLQSRTLAGIRDALLPKLVSGEIRVGEAEEYVEDVS